MIYALIEYTNKAGRIIVKGVSSQEDLEKTTEWLDRRIEKGSCLGYIATII